MEDPYEEYERAGVMPSNLEKPESRSEYFEALQEQKLSRCPHIIRKLAGDETYDICGLNTKACLIEHGIYECYTWKEIQKEWLKEAQDES